MPSTTDLPLVTFLLVAYRQEGMVAEAVRSALAQTYSPLEILLSDDGSPDGTFRVMEELVAAYQGPHRVVLNRNPRNLGLAGHLNHLFPQIRGDLVVMGAGDDVSLPQRAAVMVERWLETGRSAMAMYASLESIGPAGEPLGEHRYAVGGPDSRPLLEALADTRFAGQSAAYARKLLDGFVLPPGGSEDLPLYYRATLMRRVCYVSDSLVRYRYHADNMSGGSGRSFVFRDKRKALWRRAALAIVLPEVDALVPEEERPNLEPARRHLILVGIRAESRIRVLESFVGRWSEALYSFKTRHPLLGGLLLAPLRLLYRLAEIALNAVAIAALRPAAEGGGPRGIPPNRP